MTLIRHQDLESADFQLLQSSGATVRPNQILVLKPSDKIQAFTDNKQNNAPDSTTFEYYSITSPMSMPKWPIRMNPRPS